MEFTGERYIPGILDNTAIAFEHWQRYLSVSKMVEGKVVLDIACGEGYGADLLAKNALQVYGVDISKETIAHASNKYVKDNLSFKCGSVDKLEFNEQTVDIIVSFETIEHVDEETQKLFLNEVNRVLKKDGILVISCPNKKVATDFAWEVWQYKNEFHVKEYYIEEFYEFLNGYFKHIQLAYQRYEVALLLSSASATNLEVIMGQENDYEHTQNIIAVCSNFHYDDTRLDSIVLKNPTQYLNNQTTFSVLQKKNEILETNVTELIDEIAALQERITHLKDDCSHLQTENTQLCDQNEKLQASANELDRICNTRSWMLLNKVYAFKKVFLHK